MLKKEKIQKKLTRSFFAVSMISAIAAVVGLIAILVISNRYSYTITNIRITLMTVREIDSLLPSSTFTSSKSSSLS